MGGAQQLAATEQAVLSQWRYGHTTGEQESEADRGRGPAPYRVVALRVQVGQAGVRHNGCVPGVGPAAGSQQGHVGLLVEALRQGLGDREQGQ